MMVTTYIIIFGLLILSAVCHYWLKPKAFKQIVDNIKWFLFFKTFQKQRKEFIDRIYETPGIREGMIEHICEFIYFNDAGRSPKHTYKYAEKLFRHLFPHGLIDNAINIKEDAGFFIPDRFQSKLNQYVSEITNNE